ncbi:T9SS type A sorting domain-containing protein, partial [Aequorivita viscosa]|nr:T9SS type A sorting domain-containing protein [Aequorivita viscosa]
MKQIITLLALLFSAISIQAQDPNILWQRTIGGSEWDEPSFISKTNDGGFVVGGFSESNISGEKTENSRGGYDYWVLKFDSTGNIQWQRTLGGNEDDYLKKIIQTFDNGYLVLGYSSSNISGDKTEDSQGGTDYWILKLDAVGNIMWQNTIGSNENDTVSDIEQTPDGGFLIGGKASIGVSGDKTVVGDIWILKVDLNGNIIWQRGYDFFFNSFLSNTILTNDGGFILAGTGTGGISSDYIVSKLNTNGNSMWEKTYGGDGEDFLANFILTNDGGYIAIGHSNSDASGDKTEDSQGYQDYWVLKLDSTGRIMWQNTIGGASGDIPLTVIESSDGGYFISGSSLSNISGDKTDNTFEDSQSFWIMKLNSVGIIEWQNDIDGSLGERLPKAIQNNDGSFIICGQSSSNISGDKTEDSRGEADFWIIKHAQTLGLEENPFATTITLYPNPTKNTLLLNTKDQTIDQINIYTMTGSKVLHLDAETISPTVDVSSLAAGIYYIQLYS